MINSDIFYAQDEDVHILKLVGDIRLHTSRPLDDFFKYYIQTKKVHELIVDLSNTTMIDSTGLGLLAQLAIGFFENENKKPALVCVSQDIARILSAVQFDTLFTIVNKAQISKAPLQSLPQPETEDERQIAERALEAHRILSSLSQANKRQFYPVVEILEKELKGEN